MKNLLLRNDIDERFGCIIVSDDAIYNIKSFDDDMLIIIDNKFINATSDVYRFDYDYVENISDKIYNFIMDFGSHDQFTFFICKDIIIS